jgi:hypothetical protein
MSFEDKRLRRPFWRSAFVKVERSKSKKRTFLSTKKVSQDGKEEHKP